jgi:6-phosphogluconolactonase
MKIEVFADANSVAQEAARGSFVMAVSGGHAPWLMLRALAREEVPWNAVHVIWVGATASKSRRSL